MPSRSIQRTISLAATLLATACIGTLIAHFDPNAHRGVYGASRFLQAGEALSEEMQQVLDQHNVYRCMHDVPLLSWDAEIAEQAQAWADRGIYAHSSWTERLPACQGHTPVGCGENIAWGWPSRSGTDVTIAWYSEIEHTDPYGLVPSYTPDIGHYTQVVWEKTTKLGCGKGRVTRFGREGDFWVCQYGPAGNYGGQFEANVLAPTKSVESCGGSKSDIPCVYSSFPNTAVYMQGTGGTKIKYEWYEPQEDVYLNVCKENCNSDPTCAGFVDDPTDVRGRMCKPKTAVSGYSKPSKTFYRKGDGC